MFIIDLIGSRSKCSGAYRRSCWCCVQECLHSVSR